MSACIEIGGGEQICEGVIVHLHDEWLVDEILLEMICNSPL